MAIKNKSQLLAEIAAFFPDNTGGDISPEDVRTSLTNIVESLFPWDQIEDKPTEFDPVAHSHTSSDVIDSTPTSEYANYLVKTSKVAIVSGDLTIDGSEAAVFPVLFTDLPSTSYSSIWSNPLSSAALVNTSGSAWRLTLNITDGGLNSYFWDSSTGIEGPYTPAGSNTGTATITIKENIIGGLAALVSTYGKNYAATDNSEGKPDDLVPNDNEQQIVSRLLKKVTSAETDITLTDDDHSGAILFCTSSSAVTITVPDDLAASFNCLIVRYGSGSVTIEEGVGATVNSASSAYSIAERYSAASIMQVASAEYFLSGNLE
jgi:hypothetical protein